MKNNYKRPFLVAKEIVKQMNFEDARRKKKDENMTSINNI